MSEYLIPITKQNIHNILVQMGNSFYKINDINLICFFTKIKYKKLNIPVMITNFQIIDYTTNNKSIDIFINNELSTIEFGKVKYSNRDNDLAIIQIKHNENSNINYLELDDMLYEKEFEKYYNKKSMYVLNVNNEKDITLIFSVIHDIFKNEILFSSYFGKTHNNICPIFNLYNNKLISIYKHNKHNYKYHNKVILLKPFITEFINEYKNSKIEKSDWNEIRLLIKVHTNDLNKKIYFLDKENNNKIFEELNDTNAELYIDEIKYKYKNYFKPELVGKYKIILKFKLNLTDSSYMFANCENIVHINFFSFDTKCITSMKYMFHKCKNLKYVNLLIFDTQNVIDMSDMFSFCENLNNLDISSFNIKNIINASYMFYYCYNLTNLSLFRFDSANIIYTDYMFDMCSKLKRFPCKIKNNNFINKYPNEIDVLISIKKNDINNKIYFLNGLEELKEIYINDKKYEYQKYYVPKEEGDYKFNLKFSVNLTNCCNMFANCENITHINFIRFYTSNINNMRLMFSGCKNLKYLNLSFFDTENVNSMSCMFSGCNNLVNIDLSSFNTKNVTNMSSMFSGCNNLVNLNLSSFNTKSVKSMNSMFSGCNNLNSLNLSSFNTENVIDMSQMFDECNSLNKLNLSSFDTKNVENMNSMFYNCNNLIYLNLSSFDTKNVEDMSCMFYGCCNLKNLELTSFKTKNVKNMNKMFYGCKLLNYLDLSSFNTKHVTDMSQMFYYCKNLTILNIPNFNTKNVLNTEQMFYKCPYKNFLLNQTMDNSVRRINSSVV